MGTTKFDKLKATEVVASDATKVFPKSAVKRNALADLSAAAAITAATTDATAAKLTDVQALRTTVNLLVTQINELKAGQVAFGERTA